MTIWDKENCVLPFVIYFVAKSKVPKKKPPGDIIGDPNLALDTSDQRKMW